MTADDMNNAGDAAELRRAIAEDDGARVSSTELIAELDDAGDAAELRRAIAEDDGARVSSTELMA